MKRSEINIILEDALEFMTSLKVPLPPFAHWTPEYWRTLGPEALELAERGLGWDVTDFGSSSFAEVGLLLFTIRNGNPNALLMRQGKVYAEKILVVGEGQVTPTHFHFHKTEDIINRGGGILALELHWAAPDDTLSRQELEVSVDGVVRTVSAGSVVRLAPGESITLPSRMYHRFWAEGGRVLAGEVSSVNDDFTDNHFLETLGRFPTIEEDTAPFRLLVGDYTAYYTHATGGSSGGY